jgi:glyoxylase-like metal-dependent hydrolase (beta-lactamase superfamily II)
VHVETFAVGPLGCNCSIVAEDAPGTHPAGRASEPRRAIVVDPGGDFDEIKARLDALGAHVVAIVHTHAHVDHVGSTAELQRATGAAASIHEGDRFLYRALPVQAALMGTPFPKRADMDGKLVDGVAIRAGSLELGVLHTPGHTPGSCCFVASDGERSHLFAGDTLFRGSVGRTDLWGGDHGALLRSIRHKVLSLPDDVPVVAGHGPSTSVGRERAHNPFLRVR